MSYTATNLLFEMGPGQPVQYRMDSNRTTKNADKPLPVSETTVPAASQLLLQA
jgi:hypothetical protein